MQVDHGRSVQYAVLMGIHPVANRDRSICMCMVWELIFLSQQFKDFWGDRRTGLDYPQGDFRNCI